jgi:hypothetical protein
METNYHLEEEDLLTYFLYTASKSESQQAKFKKAKYFIPLVLLGLCGFAFFLQNYNLCILFAIAAIFMFLFYPGFLKRRVETHFKTITTATFKKSSGKSAFIKFSNQQIYCKDNGTESKINYSEIEEFSEISHYIFVKIKSGMCYVFTKKRLENVKQWQDFFKDLATQLNIHYKEELNWKW